MQVNKIYIKNQIKMLAEPLIKIIGKGKRFLPEKRFYELLHKNFTPGEDFYFIQVGANDGISFDILYDVVKERKSRGIVIEPLEDFYAKLCVNYKDFPEVIKVKKAVHPTDKSVTMYRVDPAMQKNLQSWTSGIASLDPLHHKKSDTDSKYIIEEQVEALPLMEIITQAQTGFNIDLLQIDVEGFDFEILKMVDFRKIKPLVIKFEFSNLSAQDLKSSKLLLKNNGYYLFTNGDDMIAILLHKIRL